MAVHQPNAVAAQASPPRAPAPTATLPTAGTDGWEAYGHDALGSRFSPLGQIDRGNVGRLQVAWTYHTGELGERGTRGKSSFEATPLVVDGTLFFSTPLGRVIALDPETGAERWVFDAHVDRGAHYGDFTSRGVSTWVDPQARPGEACRRRIVLATIDARGLGFDAATGRAGAGLGAGGTLVLNK
jgi:quinoprotein glucose dehydrogenase